MMPNDHYLAWRLADELAGHFAGADRHAVFVQLGVGDIWSAITTMLTIAVRDRLVVPEALVAEFVAWLDRYRGGLDERPIRTLLAGIPHHLGARR